LTTRTGVMCCASAASAWVEGPLVPNIERSAWMRSIRPISTSSSASVSTLAFDAAGFALPPPQKLC
jgi:hypothetical protein